MEQLLLKAEHVHESFRLWITAEPHPAFPIGLLQMGIKITNEAPAGIRAGLRASYQWVTQVCPPPVSRAPPGNLKRCGATLLAPKIQYFMPFPGFLRSQIFQVAHYTRAGGCYKW